MRLPILFLALCWVAVSDATFLRLLRLKRIRDGTSDGLLAGHGLKHLSVQPSGQSSAEAAAQPRSENEHVTEDAALTGGASADLAAGIALRPGTTIIKHTKKTERTETHTSKRSESHKSESTSISTSRRGSAASVPSVSQAELDGIAGQTQVDASPQHQQQQQDVQGQLRATEISPRQYGGYGGVRQKANIHQNAGGYGGGLIRQNANINQGISGGYGGHGGGVDQNANIGQHASFRGVPSSGADIRQNANVRQSASPSAGGARQNVNVRQDANLQQQGGIQGSGSVQQHADVQQGLSDLGGAGGAVTSGGAAGDGFAGGAQGELAPTVDGRCGANSAYCVNVNDEGFYPSTDARGHFYRCSHCSPHFFRCGPGTAYHPTSRACL